MRTKANRVVWTWESLGVQFAFMFLDGVPWLEAGRPDQQYHGEWRDEGVDLDSAGW